eukprot:2468173-Amphidinium_carterae.1
MEALTLEIGIHKVFKLTAPLGALQSVLKLLTILHFVLNLCYRYRCYDFNIVGTKTSNASYLVIQEYFTDFEGYRLTATDVLIALSENQLLS